MVNMIAWKRQYPPMEGVVLSSHRTWAKAVSTLGVPSEVTKAEKARDKDTMQMAKLNWIEKMFLRVFLKAAYVARVTQQSKRPAQEPISMSLSMSLYSCLVYKREGQGGAQEDPLVVAK